MTRCLAHWLLSPASAAARCASTVLLQLRWRPGIRTYPPVPLSFGFVDVADEIVTLTKTVRIRNYANKQRIYSVTPTFRFANDITNGAVSVSAPAKVVKVKPGLEEIRYSGHDDHQRPMLRGNFMNSGSQAALTRRTDPNEYDGYLIWNDGSDHPIHMAWHVLPRKAANVVPDTSDLVPGAFPQVIGLDNTGVGTAQNDAYALLAVSPICPNGGLGEQEPTPDIRAVGINTFPVPAGFCSANASFIWAFAVNTWETPAAPAAGQPPGLAGYEPGWH
jgi:minor extracellular serine protease Vpr